MSSGEQPCSVDVGRYCINITRLGTERPVAIFSVDLAVEANEMDERL